MIIAKYKFVYTNGIEMIILQIIQKINWLNVSIFITPKKIDKGMIIGKSKI